MKETSIPVNEYMTHYNTYLHWIKNLFSMFQVTLAPSESTFSVEVGEESQALSESQGQQVRICQTGSTLSCYWESIFFLDLHVYLIVLVVVQILRFMLLKKFIHKILNIFRMLMSYKKERKKRGRKKKTRRRKKKRRKRKYNQRKMMEMMQSLFWRVMMKRR